MQPKEIVQYKWEMGKPVKHVWSLYISLLKYKGWISEEHIGRDFNILMIDSEFSDTGTHDIIVPKAIGATDVRS